MTHTRDLVVLALAATTAAGCVTMGPQSIVRDRFDYATTIGESAKAQTLMNIVKLRYSDWPTFLELNQVVAGYNWQHEGSASLGVRTGIGAETGSLGYTGQYIERPTITYTPLTGEKFVRSILTSVRPDIVLSLIQSGWPADTVVEILLQSLNGVPNPGRMGGAQTDAGAFRRFGRVLRAAQLAGAIAVDFEDGDHPVAQLGFRRGRLDPADRAELEQLERELGLDPNAPKWRVVWETSAVDPSTLALQTRSTGQVLVDLASYVDVPEEHVARGLTPPPARATGGDRASSRLITIHSGEEAPRDAYVTVEYLGTRFWIDATDLRSKQTFTYVLLVLTVTEAGSSSLPQLTISTN